MTTGATRREMLVTRIGWGLSLLALVALGVLWRLDRSRAWEVPRWDRAWFDVLRDRGDGAAAGAAGPTETWAVVVNPECSSCLASLRAALATRERQRAPIRIAALIVDTPERPGRDVSDGLAADAVWWDRDQRWRKRWGHRVYGEVLCFDAGGALVRTLGPMGADAPP
jgi:hypothetical protein